MNMNKRSLKYKISKLNRTRSYSSGFTILELMIASAVFAVVLLVVAIGAISLTNSYYKGITSSDVQSVARAIMSEVSQSIQFSANL
jgi:prepilin-type N-terminal cleavage/methylation domain-containing protein